MKSSTKTEINIDIHFKPGRWLHGLMFVVWAVAFLSAAHDLYSVYGGSKTLSTWMWIVDVLLLILVPVLAVLELIAWCRKRASNKPGKTLGLFMPDDAWQALQQIRRRSGSKDEIATLRKALAYLDMVLDWEAEGGRVVFRKENTADEVIARVSEHPVDQGTYVEENRMVRFHGYTLDLFTCEDGTTLGITAEHESNTDQSIDLFIRKDLTVTPPPVAA